VRHDPSGRPAEELWHGLRKATMGFQEPGFLIGAVKISFLTLANFD